MSVASAAAAASLIASTSLSVPDRIRLHPRPALPPLPCFRRRSRVCLVRAILEDRPSPPAEEDAKRYGLNGNGSGLGYDDAAVQAYLGSNGNGSASGNGGAVKQNPEVAGSSAAIVPAPVPPAEDERRRKERVEEIGREDAWFKQNSAEVNIFSVCM